MCVCVCMCVCMPVRVCMCVGMHVRMHRYVHARTSLCVCTPYLEIDRGINMHFLYALSNMHECHNCHKFIPLNLVPGFQ